MRRATSHTFLATQVGQLLLVSRDGLLARIEFERGRHAHGVPAGSLRDDAGFDPIAAQISEYLAGERQGFDVPMDPGGTAFQREVWSALRRIPYGTTCSYSDIARQIGRPAAVRAVGAANGLNPLPIVIPCHRVVGKNGGLTGFGGGLATKRWLLELEGALGQETPRLAL
ncbi:MAG: methylated-DNA--[protein]-cysteine S-methyltransferase [Acidobacteriota bacterium]